VGAGRTAGTLAVAHNAGENEVGQTAGLVGEGLPHAPSSVFGSAVLDQ
jgi:hypothetical protein